MGRILRGGFKVVGGGEGVVLGGEGWGGSEREDWSKGKGREIRNVLRELQAEASGHCPLPLVPPSSIAPTCEECNK